MLKNKEKDLLASLIIGDGSIFKYNNTYSIFVGHGFYQKDYCQWKLDLLNQSGIFKNQIKMHTKKNGTDGKYILYYFKKTDFCLKYMYDNLITRQKKTLDMFLKFMYTNQATAIWFMDDGSVEYSRKKHKDGKYYWCRPNMKLCTNCFTFEENVKIQKWFRDKYNVECKIKLEKGRKTSMYTSHDTYYLRFGVDATEKLYKEVLQDYVHCCQSMEHKFRYAIQAFESNNS